jgi:threonine/homoserine/homoserine lactone efflux protein
MPDLSTLLLFAGATLLLIAIPGPSVLYIVAQSVEHGRKAGLVSVAGVHAGSLVHIGAAAVGISSLLVSSATAFAFVKYAGAAYLIYLGLQRFREPAKLLEADEMPAAPLGRLFKRGIIVNVLNPKTAIFFLALLPQFIDPHAGSAFLQVIALGIVWLFVAGAGDSVWALVAGTLGGWLRKRRRAAQAEKYSSGSILVGLGMATALASVRKTA